MATHGLRVVSVCFMLMLGSEAAPGSSAEFSPKVTTYTLPVPVFGDTSAVEGVLTAARHTAAEGIAGLGQETTFATPDSSVEATSSEDTYYALPTSSGSDGSSAVQNPSPGYAAPSPVFPSEGGQEHFGVGQSPAAPSRLYASPATTHSGSSASNIGSAPAAAAGSSSFAEASSSASQENFGPSFSPASPVSPIPSYSLPSAAPAAAGTSSFSGASSSANQGNFGPSFSPVFPSLSYGVPSSAPAAIGSSSFAGSSAGPAAAGSQSFAGSSSFSQGTGFSSVPLYYPPSLAQVGSAASSSPPFPPSPSYGAPSSAPAAVGSSSFAGSSAGPAAVGSSSFSGASSSASQANTGVSFAPIFPVTSYGPPGLP
ncbi:nuclear pore complex protein NUP62-like isoform X2 [Zootermopsis nevadensis]|uniref:nuclear pore complex protein NUP62-like isoform X2 n=1 Tax=Zootermopsis nevadensis TaxID=136037 RepID=UPI000B8E599A|nr:nuclear pore complex protein NUP62-like isoform X2 [Zootermopsis nevadensis]